MKVDYVTIGPPLDVHAWSGTEYFIAKSLEDQSASLHYVGDLETRKTAMMHMKRIGYKLIGKRYDFLREPEVALSFAQQVKERSCVKADVIFSPGCVATAFLDTKKPKVTYTDAPYGGLIDFYEGFAGLCDETVRKGHELEQHAIDTASLVLYSSEWAAETAAANYRIDPGKVHVIPMGANIDYVITHDHVEKSLRARSRTRCDLLFLGVEWERKGGDLAIGIVNKLNALGIHATLHVVGIPKLPVSCAANRFIRNHGYINKVTEQGRMRFEKLMRKCHFLLVPSRAEAYGIVFCEANSYAMPCISTAVGGIPTIVKDNINGRLFDVADTEETYASFIADTFTDLRRYHELCKSSYNEFATRLNWKVAGRQIFGLLKEC